MAKNNPKLIKLPKTANEIIADRAIRHALYLERYKTQVVNEIIKLLNMSLEPKLIDKIEKSLRDITGTSKQLQSIFKHNGELIKAEYKVMEEKLYDNLRGYAPVESQWLLKTLENSTPIALDFVSPAPKLLKNLITTQPMQGVLLGQWFNRLATDTAFKVNQQIQLGIIEGEGIEKIVRRIKGTRAAQYSDGILNISRHHLRSVVRTSVSHIAHTTREEIYRENPGLIKGVQITATLDTRTCFQCMNQDGKVYEIDKGQRPPFHHSCRCSTICVLKSWKELGIKLSEAPEGTRASMNGQVPDSLTYPAWLKKQCTEIQNDALGESRAKMFRSGKVKLKEFVDRRNKPLTLKELRSLAS